MHRGITRVHRGITIVHSGEARRRRRRIINPIHAAFEKGLGDNSLLPLVEAVVHHSLKRSLETQNVKNVQNEHTQFLSPEEWRHHYCHSIPLVADIFTCLFFFVSLFLDFFSVSFSLLCCFSSSFVTKVEIISDNHVAITL